MIKNMSLIIEINEPFWSAGDKFGWSDKYGRTGIGINEKLLHGDGQITVRIGKKESLHRITRERARELLKEYKSYYQARSTRIAVLPLQAFESDIPNVFKKSVEYQKRLF